ncbi:MAG: helix-turn-helix domain-containing protein [Ruminococcus sp.]|nr:helix-turn-helix domain-containing protein [Ruminococcus sp.]
MTFGEFVRAKRKEALLSQREFAERIGVSPVYVSYFESGERNAPRRECLMRMVPVLNLNEQEKQKLLFLAAQQKYNQNIPSEIATYIHDNDYAKDTLRLAQECQITDEDWRFFIKYISNKYL